MKLMTTCACVSLLVLGGCVVAPAERDGLPNGVTLLDSDDGHCSGTVQIEGNSGIRVDDGEQTVLAVDDDHDIDWQCVSGADVDEGEFECPDGTSYIRVSRLEGEAEFTLECYGA